MCKKSITVARVFKIILIQLMIVSMCFLVGCVDPPQNSKIHENVKITVLDAYHYAPVGDDAGTRLIAMTSIRPYPVIIQVANGTNIIDELTLVRMFKTVENFTFKSKKILEDLNVENSMAFFMYADDIVLFPNNNIDLKSGYAVSTDDMTPITLPGRTGRGQKPTYDSGGGNGNATATNTVTINVNDKDKH